MQANLTLTEVRVLGCLVEKDLATPDYYPLSLNALTNACNQKSNREPVLELTESEVLEALDSLRRRGLALQSGEGGRVPKFGHNLEAKLFLDRPELAVLAELLLRGPQTIGELRARAGRMHLFASMEEIEEALGEMADREVPLVQRLPRQPGRKESRHAQLLSGRLESPSGTDEDQAERMEAAGSREGERIDLLEREVKSLRDELDGLRRELAEFRSQFD